MSTKYAFALCDNNERAGKVLESFLDSNHKFDALDVVSGNRLYANFQRYGILSVNDIPVIKAKFIPYFNMYFMSVFNEQATEIPKNLALYQNITDMANIICMANGEISNKEYICRQYEFGLGQSLSEFIAGYYMNRSTKLLNTFSLANMIRDIECDSYLSFVIFDKNKNEIFVYNRGDELYISNIPGNNVIVTTDVVPYNTMYPQYNFHKLPGNCALKIDSKTMYIQNTPILCNTFSYGKDLMIDPDKAVIYTDTCDMELCSALSLLTNKEISNVSDLQIMYFGFSTDVDRLVFDKICKLRKTLKANGRMPVHIPYTFSNIYTTESEVIDEINRKIADSVDIENQLDPNKRKKTKDRKTESSVKPVSIRDATIFESKRINYVASTIVNWILEKGVGTIFIPNINRRNNRLINVLKSLLKVQVNTPIYVYSLFEEYSTMDMIRYLINCKNMLDLDDILTNSDRYSMRFEVDDKGKAILKYDSSSKYNEDVYYAFVKCGLANPFENRYVGKLKINNILANAALVPDSVMTSEQKNIFMNTFTTVTKNDLAYQRKLQAF